LGLNGVNKGLVSNEFRQRDDENLLGLLLSLYPQYFSCSAKTEKYYYTKEKKDAKSFSVLVLSVNNILGRKNIFGYNFSNDGLRSSPILPSANTFVFIGAFISFGVDRTQDAINNNL